MPHPSSIESLHNLRRPRSQCLHTAALVHHTSMPCPDSFAHNASLRRPASRRARPSVVAVADLFIGSLAMAGYCQEHSPRNRGLSKVSPRAGKHAMAERERRARSTRQLLPKKPESLGMTRRGLRGYHTRTQQQMPNSGVAQKQEDVEADGFRVEGKPFNHSFSAEYSRQTPPESRQSSSEGSKRVFFEGSYCNVTTTADSRAPDAAIEENATHSLPDPPDETDKYNYQGKPSSTKDLHASTSSFYRRAFGNSFDWKRAADAVAGDIHAGLLAVLAPRPRQEETRYSEDIGSVDEFVEALWNDKLSNQYIFRLYRTLPYPGVSYLSKASRSRLLRRFANPKNRRGADVRKYLALVEDMMAAELPMSRSLWTSAISLAGRAMGKVTKKDLVRALGIWQQMEHVGGIRSDGVVFNVLFDIAIRAGQFIVAERLMDDMRRRGVGFLRAGKVTKIWYHGLRGDVDGILHSYDEFVESGEIVDTVVLNCMLASFIQAGELKKAEQLYHGMVQSQKELRNANPQDCSNEWRLSSEFLLYRTHNRKLNNLLQISASLKGRLPEQHKALQKSVPMTPDTRTFHILLSHYACKSGNLNGVMSVIDDMEKIYKVPPKGMIYLMIFNGFTYHGRRRKGWTAERLQDVWKKYLRALYESKNRLLSRSEGDVADPVWEHPLRDDAEVLATPPLVSPQPKKSMYTALPSENQESMEDSPGLHLPLPSKDGLPGFEAQHQDIHQPQDEELIARHSGHIEDGRSEAGGVLEGDEEVADVFTDADELFQNRMQDSNDEANSPEDPEQFEDPVDEEEEDDHDEENANTAIELAERRIENGVFLGRRMIINILRAFGTCCGPHDVMEVWLKMERIWKPDLRRATDVLAVREELEKQLNKGRRYY